MEYQIGKQIRSFRLRGNMTQERLAEKLGLTAQTVSKWETGMSYPDITLLPELTAALGITVDELFESATETHLRRIEQMLESVPMLSDEDFTYAERQLKRGCLDRETRGRCLTMLAELYNQQADGYRIKAEETAKEALELEPEKKDNHSALCQAAGGVLWDWCCSNHTRLIDYYRDFVGAHPNYAPGYLWYMDNLLGDGRIAEAEEALEAMGRVRDSYHYLLYKGWILEKQGKSAEAEACWAEMTEQFAGDSFAWSSLADAYAKRADYDQALADYYKAAALEEKPRFTDNWDSIAQLCLLKGDTAGAIHAYEQVVEILRNDWNMPEGETVTGYLQNIAQLKRG